MTKRIRVLVVDDSAFARKVIREVLSRDPEIDVVVSASASDSDLALEALQNGAIDLVMKPTPLPTDRLYDLSSDLIAKVKAAANARPFAEPNSSAAIPKLLVARPITAPVSTKLVVIGTSTGGPQALTTLFKALPSGLPVPLAIALHIPAGYTMPLAARLSKLGSVPVVEAANGMELVAGQAVIAPGGLHLTIHENENKFYALVSREPRTSIYHPSVDLLFESASKAAGSGVLGLVMTGMGSDGLEGSKIIRERGGRILAESASSCVVFGMPRCVIEEGFANHQAPLEQIPNLLVEQIYK